MTCQAEHRRKLLCSGISGNFMTVLRKWSRLLDLKMHKTCRPSIVSQTTRPNVDLYM